MSNLEAEKAIEREHWGEGGGVTKRDVNWLLRYAEPSVFVWESMRKQQESIGAYKDQRVCLIERFSLVGRRMGPDR